MWSVRLTNQDTTEMLYKCKKSDYLYIIDRVDIKTYFVTLQDVVSSVVSTKSLSTPLLKPELSNEKFSASID